MNDIQTFLKTDRGRYVLIGVMVIIAAFIMYVVFFKKHNPDNVKENIQADTNVSVKDTAFKNRGNVYSAYDKKEKQVDSDNDFFKSGTEEMKEAINSTDSEQKNQKDLQKMADSILLANQTKVNYGKNNQKTSGHSYGSHKNRSTSSSYKKREDDVDKFQKESQKSFDAFFKTENNRGDKKDSKYAFSNKDSQLPSDAMIYAIISGDQIIKNKDRVTLKLSRDAIINGQIFKRNTFIYAIASFAQNRVNLAITNINQIPLTLIAMDAMDGNKGIYIEGESLLAETVNEASEDGVKDLEVRGIPVGKTIKKIITKKQRIATVQLLNNYKIILKTE